MSDLGYDVSYMLQELEEKDDKIMKLEDQLIKVRKVAKFYSNWICELESKFYSGELDDNDFWYARNGRNSVNETIIDSDDLL